jgi:hypothetical protein
MVDILFRRTLLGDIEESSWLIFCSEELSWVILRRVHG